jgi:hypothetical protein
MDLHRQNILAMHGAATKKVFQYFETPLTFE